VKNNLQVLASLLRLQADESRETDVKCALADAVSRISVMAMLHAQLYEDHGGLHVDMKRFVTTLAENLLRTLAGPDIPVTISLRLDSFSLPIAQATPCGLLVNELVTNAFRHAFAGGVAGAIEIEAREHDGVATIVVRDTGPGLPLSAAHDSSGGFGMRLIQLLATRQLRGHVSMTNPRGLQFVVTFSTRPGAVDVPDGVSRPRLVPQSSGRESRHL
jgi:two-component sensor histidine kinase